MRFLSVNANAFLIEFTSLQDTMAAYRTLQHARQFWFILILYLSIQRP